MTGQTISQCEILAKLGKGELSPFLEERKSPPLTVNVKWKMEAEGKQ